MHRDASQLSPLRPALIRKADAELMAQGMHSQLAEVTWFPVQAKGEIMFSMVSPFLPGVILAALLGMLAVGSFAAWYRTHG